MSVPHITIYRIFAPHETPSGMATSDIFKCQEKVLHNYLHILDHPCSGGSIVLYFPLVQ